MWKKHCLENHGCWQTCVELNTSQQKCTYRLSCTDTFLKTKKVLSLYILVKIILPFSHMLTQLNKIPEVYVHLEYISILLFWEWSCQIMVEIKYSADDWWSISLGQTRNDSKRRMWISKRKVTVCFKVSYEVALEGILFSFTKDICIFPQNVILSLGRDVGNIEVSCFQYMFSYVQKLGIWNSSCA